MARLIILRERNNTVKYFPSQLGKSSSTRYSPGLIILGAGGFWLGSQVPALTEGKNRNIGELFTDSPMGDGVSPVEDLLSDSQACKQKFWFLSNLSGNCKFTESCTEGQLFLLV